jgi:hypothetical protein
MAEEGHTSKDLGSRNRKRVDATQISVSGIARNLHLQDLDRTFNTGTGPLNRQHLMSVDNSPASSIGDDSVEPVSPGISHRSSDHRRLQVQPSFIRQSHFTKNDITFDHMNGKASETGIDFLSCSPSPTKENSCSHQFEDGSEAGDDISLVCKEVGCTLATREKKFANRASLR